MQMAQPDDFACPSYRHVKLFVWLWDVPVGGGATTVVPSNYIYLQPFYHFWYIHTNYVIALHVSCGHWRRTGCACRNA